MSAQILPLDQVMGYQNPRIVSRLQTKYGLPQEKAQELFDDTKRFLFLAASTREAISPTKQIDIGWHEFILFTKDYAEFCKKNFGCFIHHAPTLPGESSAKTRPVQDVAREAFGDCLSGNWAAHKKGECDADSCSPEKNCESPPADCAVNHIKAQAKNLGGECDAECAPEKNCESPPADCAVNH